MEANRPKFPKLKKCTFWGEGTCAGTGCATQALMENSKDLGDSQEAEERRDQIENDAKAAHCGATPLARPKFKK